MSLVPSPRQILVTGGAGFIGSHVVKTLRQRYPEARIRVLHQPRENLFNLRHVNGIELMAGDVTRQRDVVAAVAGCDAVFHLAAVYALWLPDMSVMDRVNVDGTRRVLQACKDAGVKRVVHTSSIAVFAGQGEGVAATEQSAFQFWASDYSRSKYESHIVAKEFARQGLDVVMVCPAMPIGPGDIGPTPTGRIITEAFKSPFLLAMDTGPGCYIDVRDCAMGHVLALEKGGRGESYILGGENYDHYEIMQRLCRIAGLHGRIRTVSLSTLKPFTRIATWLSDHVTHKPPFFTPVEIEITRKGLKCDAAKARKELGLTVRPIDDSLRDAVAWFAANGYLPASARALSPPEAVPA